MEDYALYVVLKKQHADQPWHLWPEAFRFRDKKALNEFIRANDDAIQNEKWLQWQFSRQWAKLRKYCNQMDIQIIGDLPFYVSYDSVDVWANPEFFRLNKDGQMIDVAGVPPDYFSKDGQLWGMPVYNWDELKTQGYKWWVQRIRKNLERFDLLRLDHFRAFTDYWSVPAEELTAINGRWNKGPGAELFKTFTKTFGRLPFVAEDLGDIDDAVYELRDKFNLPGMRVLQFAFGENAALSLHMPHNYSLDCIAYTGTHDNNTTLGWYRTEADGKSIINLKAYAGQAVKDKNVHYLFVRMAMASVANTVIIPMQDLLGLDEGARMNNPAAEGDNWQWRYLPVTGKKDYATQLKQWTRIFNRL